MQHVALRMQIRPYLDQLVWEKILRKTDWITCLRLDHLSIGKELVPPEEEAQSLLDSAVACGDTLLVSRMLQTFDGFPSMDTAAKADQFEMLKFLDRLDKAGSCICLATSNMSGYAAANSNLVMLEWLITNRLEVNGLEMLSAAAGVGNIFVIHWILQQAEQLNRIFIDLCQAREALRNALRAGHLDIALFLIDHFSLHDVACEFAITYACLPVAQKIITAYSKDPDQMDWHYMTLKALMRSDDEILCMVLQIMRKVKGKFPERPPCPLLEVAAKYGTVSLMQILVAQLSDKIWNSRVTDKAVTTAIGRGCPKMVSPLGQLLL